MHLSKVPIYKYIVTVYTKVLSTILIKYDKGTWITKPLKCL